MDDKDKLIAKQNLVLAGYQQKLADADMTAASLAADVQLLQQELTEKDEKIIELQNAVDGKKPPTAVRKAS